MAKETQATAPNTNDAPVAKPKTTKLEGGMKRVDR